MANLPDSYRFLDDDELFRQCLRRAFQGHFLHSPHLVPTDDGIMQFMAEAADRHHEFRENMAREAAEDTARLQQALEDEEAYDLFSNFQKKTGKAARPTGCWRTTTTHYGGLHNYFLFKAPRPNLSSARWTDRLSRWLKQLSTSSSLPTGWLQPHRANGQVLYDISLGCRKSRLGNNPSANTHVFDPPAATSSAISSWATG